MATGSQAIAAVQLLLFLLSLLSSAAAFDVMEILRPYAEYSTFTKYLVDFKLVDEINGRGTVTVLVLDNTAIAEISSLSTDRVKKIISYHVLPGYYDPYIFDRLDRTALLPSLSRKVNFTELPGERMMLGSAEPRAPVDCEIIKVVGARPYNLSVLQVTKAIGLRSGAASPKDDKSTAPAAATRKAKPGTAGNTTATVPQENRSISSVAQKADPSVRAAAPQAAAPEASAGAPQAAAPEASAGAPQVAAPESSAAAPQAAAPKAGTPVAEADAPTYSAMEDTPTSSDKADGPSLETAPGPDEDSEESASAARV